MADPAFKIPLKGMALDVLKYVPKKVHILGHHLF
jgi:hypothetical protein